MNNLKKFFKNKRIFITGHTGFKGTWLTTCLTNFGAKILGYSKNDEKRYSYEKICAFNKVQNVYADILDYKSLKNKIKKFNPQIIFHLAAKSLVSESYKDPYKTIETNTLGTLNIIEISRNLKNLKSLVIITSDKCYLNKEFKKGYKENDILGGDDPYSASKASAELIFNAYSKSFFNFQNKFGFATARAGNVIGGGDWAQDRIVPDCVRSWSKGEAVTIRNPYATRPWQHVLEPLSGYLTLALTLHEGKIGNGESFNFGPPSEQNVNVQKLIEDLSKHWNFNNKNDSFSIVKTDSFHEAGLLKLNCEKALFHLNWKPVLNYEQLITFVGEWYYKYYKGQTDMFDYTIRQIDEYQIAAKEAGLTWSR